MVYGYIRVSTDKQDTENQKVGINEKATQLGLQIDEWISDDGISGAKEPEKRLLGPLLKKVQEGDIIIVSEISRIGRTLFMVFRVLEGLLEKKVKMYSVKDAYNLDDTITSKVLAFAFGMAAEIERDMIRKRTKEGLYLKKRQGVLLGYPRGTTKAQYVKEEEIKKMESLLNEGHSLSSIAKIMKIHRITVGYHLTKRGIYKGQLIGYKLTYSNGNVVNLTRRNCTDYGLYYKHIQDAVLEHKDLSKIGIDKAEAIYRDVSVEIKDLYKRSEHPEIDHSDVERLINDNLSIPEIHDRMGEKVDYDTLYDYIQADTDLAMSYRTRGHLKVKSKKERY